MMTNSKENPTSRRWLQFSVTALLVVTTICAILFAWWRDRTQLLRQLEVEVERATLQRELAERATVMARRSEQMAHQRAAESLAALRAATSQSGSSQESGDDG